MDDIYRQANVVLAYVGYGNDVPQVYSLVEAVATLKSSSDFNEPEKSSRSPEYRQ